MFGATPMAEAGKLLVAFGDLDSTYEVAKPFLKGVIARETLRVGSEAQMATLLKAGG